MKRPVSAAVAVALGVAAIVGGLALPSQAATQSVGVSFGTGMFVGSYTTSTGVQAYCGDAAANDPSGPQVNGAIVNDYEGVNGITLAQINYVLTHYGTTGDPNTAAAVQFAVWNLRGQLTSGLVDPVGNSQGIYPGFDYYKMIKANVNQATADDIQAKFNAFVSAAKANATLASAGTAIPVPGAPTIVSNHNASHYMGTIDAAAGYTTLTLTNAVWDSTGTPLLTLSQAEHDAGGTFSWTGTPPDGSPNYQVSVQGHYSVVASTARYDAVTLYTPTVAKQQVLVAAATSATPTVSEGDSSTNTSDPLSLRFSPIITTQASSKIVNVGDSFTDNVTISAKALDAADPDNTQKWHQTSSGAYTAIVAKGTLYGPLSSEPTESATVPAGTPVAATATVTTTGTQGPGTYPVTTNEKATESGYYTWVWSISSTDQSALTQMYLADAYSFTDTFGQTVETSVTPFGVTYSTALSSNTATIGSSLTDAITTSSVNTGAWLRDKSGARIPVTLTGTVYSTTSQPTQQASAPADAKVVGSITATTTGPNQTVVSAPFDAPYTAGWVTVQWSIKKSAQPTAYQGYVTDWSDAWGIPAETAQVVGPTVKTQATPTATPLDTIKDTAIVDGPVPDKTVVSFTAYKAPVAGDQKITKDSSGNYVLAVDAAGKPVVWTDADIAALGDAKCSAQPVFVSKDVTVTKAGSYDSDAAAPQGEGTYYWVETLSTVDKGGKTVVIHVGQCGLPNETTTVSKPTVTTKATEKATVGDAVHDTATITGPIPTNPDVTTTVTFDLFKQQGDAATCTADQRVFSTVDKPITVTTAGDITSADYTPTVLGTYYWVETLKATDNKAGKETVLHVGECGLPNETTTVADKPVPVPPLADTSAAADLRAPLLGGGSLLLVVGLALGVVATRRKRLEEVGH